MEIEKSIIPMIFHNIELHHKKGNKNYLHREDGPAEIYYVIGCDDNTIITAEYYYYHNVLMTKEEWEKEVAWRKQLKNTPMGEIFLTQN